MCFTGISCFSAFNHCHPGYCDGEGSNTQSTGVSILTLARKQIFGMYDQLHHSYFVYSFECGCFGRNIYLKKSISTDSNKK